MLPFESHGGRLESYNDGHIPETFRFQTSYNSGSEGSSTPRIVNYHDILMSSQSEVHVYDGILHPHHARMLYDATDKSGGYWRLCDCTNDKKSESHHSVEGPTEEKDGTPWGTYVTIKEALNWIKWEETTQSKARFVENNKCCAGSSYEAYQSLWRQNAINFLRWQKQALSSVQIQKQKEDTTVQLASEDDESIVHKLSDVEHIRHALAVEAVARFFLQTIPSKPGSTAVSLSPDSSATGKTLYQMKQFLQHAHGVAVWALSSRLGHSVQYHIDYAELLRYEYNVTVPPLWAGTVQCSELWNDTFTTEVANYVDVCDGIHECCGHCKRPLQSLIDKVNPVGLDRHRHRPLRCCFDGIHECSSICKRPKETERVKIQQQATCFKMRGGEFCVNLRALEHYSEHGYKGTLSGDAFGGWKRPLYPKQSQSSKVFNDHTTQWITIPYAFNRGIVHSGNLPHLSAPVELIRDDKKDLQSHQTPAESLPSRVIVGFNVFGHDVGNVIAKAPEHSKSFRRKVKLYRATVGACADKASCGNMSKHNLNDQNSQNSGVNLSQVYQNKALTKLLVLAKREKVKEDFRNQQDQLSREIWRRLLEIQKANNPMPLRVVDIIDQLSNTKAVDGRIPWPTSDDVHVHLNFMLSSSQSRIFCDVDGIAGVSGARYIMVVKNINIVSPEGKNDRKCALVSTSAELDVVRCDVDSTD